MGRRSWATDLRSFLVKVRKMQPVPARDSLSLADEMRVRILGGHLLSWLQDWGPGLMRERNALPIPRGNTREPLVVYITDTPGLVAAAEILGEGSKRVLSCTRSEYESFPRRDEDEEFRVHGELHSWFDQLLPSDDSMERARTEHPLRPDEEYWLHHDASILGPLHARIHEHLWAWDGNAPRLLEENWSLVIS